MSIQPEIVVTVDGAEVAVGDSSGTLLDLLRSQLGVVEVKDGCSPQGQCGCCTVLVDGQPRVACVTPVRRLAGRQVTTPAGLDAERRQRWAECFTATGASQCGFCTPGIIVRLDALSSRLTPTRTAAGGGDTGPDGGGAGAGGDHGPVTRALAAHLCRCTGWQTIVEAWDRFHGPDAEPGAAPVGSGGISSATETPETPVALAGPPGRRPDLAARRAELEGGVPQRVGPRIALGHGRFAADEAPAGALVAVSDGRGGWVVGESLTEARAAMGKVQGRRTTARHSWPLEAPDGDWAATLRTTWVEPAYLETDAAWCVPGGEPSALAANGGAFGAKAGSPVRAAARALADQHGRAVLVLGSREDVTRWGPKRPPVAGGAHPDGTGVLHVVATPGIVDAIAAVAPGLRVVEHTVPGPATSAAIRAAGWAEALILLAGARAVGATRANASPAGGTPGPITITAPGGGTATAEIVHGTIQVAVACGDPLDEVVLRSYCIGAAHMGWSWVTGEALTVDDEGHVHDLTIRSFGITRAADTPPIEVDIERAGGEHGDRAPVNGSDAVFAAVAAATWGWLGWGRDWPLSPDRIVSTP